MNETNAWEKYGKKELDEVFAFGEDYRHFLSKNKIERECCAEAVKLAKKKGYKDLREVVKKKGKLKSGDKVYAVNMDKSIVLFHIGKKPLEDGMNIIGAHIDSPRLDIKQNPLYESDGMVLLDTHYYGGIKKYQWTTLPLAIHGVVCLADGTKINVTIGEEDTDPVMCVTEILIHLAAEQLEKKGNKVVEGEALDLLVGNYSPKKKDKDKDSKDRIKKNILSILEKKYGFKEEDFASSELEVVPAGPARNLGFDESMILGYGHDDKCCAYPSLIAQLELDATPERTAVTLLVDKEEIGSVGATGMTSNFFENMVAELLDRMGAYSELTLRRALANSAMLSSDVNSAFDVNYASAFEKRNTSFLGRGIVITKFTGARGKSGSNDANAEYLAKVRNSFDKDKVVYQTAELGKVDVGGGGTIAYILAKYGMEVVDCGIAVLSMHAPYEVLSKADLYEAKKAYKAFLVHMK